MSSVISLTLRMSDAGSCHMFSIASSAPLLEVLEPYSLQMGHNVHALFFRFDGQPILPYMTPEQLEMEDEDIIDVFVTKPSDSGNVKRSRDEDDAPPEHSKRGTEDMQSWLLQKF